MGGGTNQFDTQMILADTLQEYIAANSPLPRPTQRRIIGVAAIIPHRGERSGADDELG